MCRSGKNRTTAHYRIYRSVESDSSRQFGSAVTDHVLQLLNQLLPTVFAAHPVVRPADSCLLRKEELKDDAKKLAEKAKTALHGVHNT